MGVGQRSRQAAVLGAGIALLLTLAACVITTGDGTSSGDDPYRGSLGRGGNAPSAEQVDRTVNEALDDIERYWRTAYGEISGGQEFVPLRGGRFPYNRRDLPPSCGGESVEYQPNAFYCPVRDFIAWDEETLIPRLYADYGPFLVAVVMAHEYGHAVQARLGRQGEPTIVLEQQADCFAGSWARDVAAGNSDAFDGVQPDQLDSTIAGLLFVRDQPGTSATSQQAHGNAFDRVRAFQEGFEQGSTRCAAYRVDNLPVTEVPFTRQDDAATGGNLPYARALQLLAADLQAYWATTFPRLGGGAWDQLEVIAYTPDEPPECGGETRSREEAAGAAFYCAADGYVAFDDPGLARPLHQQLGDNAVGTLLATLFAEAAQDRLDEPTDGRAAQLQVDCLAGAWTGSLLRGQASSGDLVLSPGDLDEGVATLLVFGRTAGGDGEDRVGAFDRIGAYRDGVIDGLPACDV